MRSDGTSQVSYNGHPDVEQVISYRVPAFSACALRRSQTSRHFGITSAVGSVVVANEFRLRGGTSRRYGVSRKDIVGDKSAAALLGPLTV
jgi:hypothetical protein